MNGEARLPDGEETGPPRDDDDARKTYL